MDGEAGRVSWGDSDDDGPDDDRLRGWIPPDDRLWRHPSEILSSTAPVAGTDIGPRTRSSPMIAGATTACVLVALVAVALAIAATSSGGGPVGSSSIGSASLLGTPTTEPGSARLATLTQIDAMVTAIRPSTVAIEVTGSPGTSVSTGLVAEAGGIVVTASAALVGARAITVVESDGTRQPASVIDADTTTGLSLLQITDDLPAATFGESDPSVGAMAVAVAIEPVAKRGDPPRPHVYGGTIVSSGEALDGSALTTQFATTAVAAPLGARDLGCILLDGNGDVAGVLGEIHGSGSSTTSIFLPARLVAGVVHQLASAGVVDHGWFGVSGLQNDQGATASTLAATATSTPPAGVVVGSVSAGSPAAAAGLGAGDVIEAVDGDAVRSMADLRTALYSDPPGTSIGVTFERDGSTMTLPVVLADTDVSGGRSSP